MNIKKEFYRMDYYREKGWALTYWNVPKLIQDFATLRAKEAADVFMPYQDKSEAAAFAYDHWEWISDIYLGLESYFALEHKADYEEWKREQILNGLNIKFGIVA